MVMGVSWRDVTTAAHPVPMKDQTYVLMAYACMKVSVATALVSIGVCVCVCYRFVHVITMCEYVCVHKFVHVVSVCVCS